MAQYWAIHLKSSLDDGEKQDQIDFLLEGSINTLSESPSFYLALRGGGERTGEAGKIDGRFMLGSKLGEWFFFKIEHITVLKKGGYPF